MKAGISAAIQLVTEPEATAPDIPPKPDDPAMTETNDVLAGTIVIDPEALATDPETAKPEA